ncbi:histidine kinase [Pseudonocardia dioxanivorans CB1190]|uniref:Oxygen sensor histidine kinase NreB n=1 Tax=Pseudonocardia dioxanivorans (strain ATCC 55486 / DSM 44775 / JCM 13855 / CB1190) TaxID=675635 RepID=F4CXS0_PSEUX|nr:ATP-binding protein [Pseudonocardia dioxanivorans]AEA28726.1 histidine kinase [Pseudonocardia dioxanivorans CB1190]
MRPVVRRALVRHAVLTAVVAAVLSAITVGGLWLFANGEAHRTARDVAGRVATAVGVALSAHHYDPVHPTSRDEILRGLAPFVDSGMLARVKIWRVVGDQVQVVVSDEPRIEGERRRFDADLARRLDAGEIVVLRVPDDPEHRYERAEDRALLEAFVGFRDAWGVPMRLEVYVPVDTAATVRSAMAHLLPLVIGSLLVLAAATVPITLSLARRVERDQRDRQAVLHYGLAASERERRELAQVLHDGVVQDLAGTGLLLDALLLDETDGGRRELLGRAHGLVERDVGLLRGLLTELAPGGLGIPDIRTSLQELAAEHERGAAGTPLETTVDVADEPDAQVVALLHRIGRELLRNAVRHGAPGVVRVAVDTPGPGRVRMTVTDDGRGFDPTAPPGDGHVGLRLVALAVEERGGTLDVRSAPGDGTVVEVTLPARLPELLPSPLGSPER